ncbi:hypothetical protein T484DRAFT_3040342 [Baffinella frigidus]|nr:hypothetical protein T484DRAFT_3040342 [Cryptophyta sp. CCMP2293]
MESPSASMLAHQHFSRPASLCTTTAMTDFAELSVSPISHPEAEAEDGCSIMEKMLWARPSQQAGFKAAQFLPASPSWNICEDAATEDSEITTDVMVRSWAASDSKPRHPKTKQQRSMFKRCSSPVRAVPAPAASSLTESQVDRLTQRLDTLMIWRVLRSARTESSKDLLGNGKAAVTGMEKRFALEKHRPSLRQRRAKRPPALSWDQVEHCLDGGGGAHSALIEGGAWEASDVDANEAEYKKPSAVSFCPLLH